MSTMSRAAESSKTVPIVPLGITKLLAVTTPKLAPLMPIPGFELPDVSVCACTNVNGLNPLPAGGISTSDTSFRFG